MAKVYWLLSKIPPFLLTVQSDHSDFTVVQENLQKSLIALQMFTVSLLIYNSHVYVVLFPPSLFDWSLVLLFGQSGS